MCPEDFASFATHTSANFFFFYLILCSQDVTLTKLDQALHGTEKKPKTNTNSAGSKLFLCFSAFGPSEPPTAIPHAAVTCHRRHFVHVFEAKF